MVGKALGRTLAMLDFVGNSKLAPLVVETFLAALELPLTHTPELWSTAHASVLSATEYSARPDPVWVSITAKGTSVPKEEEVGSFTVLVSSSVESCVELSSKDC